MHRAQTFPFSHATATKQMRILAEVERRLSVMEGLELAVMMMVLSGGNLTHWTEVYSATHTNSPSNRFFRIKAERLQ
jgi:hypothetical protein